MSNQDILHALWMQIKKPCTSVKIGEIRAVALQNKKNFNSRSNTPSREKRGGFHLKKINQLYGRETRHRRKKEYDYDSRLKKRSRFKRVKGKNRL